MHRARSCASRATSWSLITEVIDREVTLPDLLAELTTAQVAMTLGCDRLPLLDPLGDDRPIGSRRRAAPVAADDRVHASRRRASEPTTYRLAVPYVIFVVSTIGEQIEGLSTYFRTQRSRRSTRRSFRHPAEHERRWDRLSRDRSG